MNGIIVNYRISRHRQTNNQAIVKVEGCDKKVDAAKLVGKKTSWKSPAGKELTGKISAAHGNKGAVRVIFDTGMPGQAIGQKILIS